MLIIPCQRFTVTFLFFTLAAGNAIYLFTRFKRYDMQLRSVCHVKHLPPIHPLMTE